MQSIELDVDVDENNEIHVRLPACYARRRAHVRVLIATAADAPAGNPRRFGQFRGQVRMSDDFNASLPDGFWLGEEQ